MSQSVLPPQSWSEDLKIQAEGVLTYLEEWMALNKKKGGVGLSKKDVHWFETSERLLSARPSWTKEVRRWGSEWLLWGDVLTPWGRVVRAGGADKWSLGEMVFEMNGASKALLECRTPISGTRHGFGHNLSTERKRVEVFNWGMTHVRQGWELRWVSGEYLCLRPGLQDVLMQWRQTLGVDRVAKRERERLLKKTNHLELETRERRPEAL